MEFAQAFPIAIIDEDYEGKQAAGRGMRQLAAAIEKEGFRVVAGLSYADARRLVNVFNTESCWLVSVDGTEATADQWRTDIHGLRFEPSPAGRRYLVDCIAPGADR